MAIIFDDGLLARRNAQALTAFDFCKAALCAAVESALPNAVVYSSAQAQGAIAPAVFIRFGQMAARPLLGGVERITIAVQCRYLPLAAEDDGENETAMHAVLDALQRLECGMDFCVCGRAAERTEAGAMIKGEICFDLCAKSAAELAEGIMQTLFLRAQAL